jgi:glucose-6-phosphate 1-epimerase
MSEHPTAQTLPNVALCGPDGAQASVLLQGAHLLSWKPAGAGEQLYLSPASSLAAGNPVRGGVPVVFPQFAKLGPLGQHGFARTLPWQLDHANSDAATAVLSLRDDATTRDLWPHKFYLQMRIQIIERQLHLELSCLNAGTTAFNFTSALHTYLAVTDINQARIRGLEGLPYTDAVDQQEKIQSEALFATTDQLNRVYRQCQPNLLLHEQQGEAVRQIAIHQQGFSDVVVWNPGEALCATLPDMTPQGYRNMLCIEAAQLSHPVHLDPGQRWIGSQSLQLL